MNHRTKGSFRASLPQFAALLGCTLVCISGCGPKGNMLTDAPEESLNGPATVEEAARLLDLSAFPMMDGAKAPRQRAIADLSYSVASDVKTAFEFQRKKLAERKWKELPNASVTGEAASGVFARGGFAVSVSTYPNGTPGSVDVVLHNQGNVNLAKLRRPPGTKPVYEGGTTAMYVTDAAVTATAEACRRLILAEGWQPYGTAGDSSHFKKNAILVGITVNSAPAQGNKTMISFSSDLMSVDLPAVPDAEDLRYSDQTEDLSFKTVVDRNTITDFYRENLTRTGWKPTLDKTVTIDDNDVMIFRNAAHDMLTLSLSPARDGKTPVLLKYQSAAELDRLIKAQAPALRAKADAEKAEEEKRLAEANKPLPKIAVTVPAEATNVEASAGEIKFTVSHSKAKAVAETWRKEFREAGWKEDLATLNAIAGALSFSKENQHLTVNYTDTGVMPAEVTLSAMGVELERSTGEK